jgi:hypothetical protein
MVVITVVHDSLPERCPLSPAHESLVNSLDRAWPSDIAAALSPDSLLNIAQGYEAWFAAYRQRAERVERLDPWQIGSLLAWMDELVAWPLPSGKQRMICRFAAFQDCGYWDDISFSDWASMLTGRAYGTWSAWKRCVQVFRHTAIGRECLERAGVDPDDAGQLAERVNIDKAARAASSAVHGLLQGHQLETLTSPGYTTTQHRHAMSVTEPEWNQEQERFVADGSAKPELVLDGSWVILFYDNGTGERVRVPVLKFADGDDPVAAEWQARIIKKMRVSVRGDSSD